MPCILKCDAFKKGLQPEAGEGSEDEEDWMNQKKNSTQHCSSPFLVHWIFNKPKKRTWTRSWRRFWYWMNRKNYVLHVHILFKSFLGSLDTTKWAKKGLEHEAGKDFDIGWTKNLNTLKTFLHAQCVEINSKEAS